jgi:hypothetical protein
LAFAIATLPFSAASRSFSEGHWPGDLLIELFVDGTVDPADEEAGDARDMRGIAALNDAFRGP